MMLRKWTRFGREARKQVGELIDVRWRASSGFPQCTKTILDATPECIRAFFARWDEIVSCDSFHFFLHIHCPSGFGFVRGGGVWPMVCVRDSGDSVLDAAACIRAAVVK